MAEQWHWKHRGELLGPFETAELESLVRANRLSRGDSVQLVGDERWYSASEIAGLFAREQPQAAAGSASKLVANYGRMRRHLAADNVGFDAPNNRSFSIRSTVAQVADVLGGILAPVLDFACGVWTRRIIFGLILGAILWGWLAGKDWWSDGQHRRIVAELEQAWVAIDELREASSAEEVWREFRETHVERLSGLASELRTRAASHPHNAAAAGSAEWWTAATRRKLISATDAMTSVIQQLPEESRAAVTFQRDLREAKSLLAREPLPASTSVIRTNSVPAPEKPGPSLLVVGCVVLTGVAFGAVLVVWLRRR